MNSKKEKRNEMMEMIAHLCVGLSISMKGLDKLEHPGKEFIGLILILAGIVVLVGSFSHKKLEPWIGNFKLYIFGIESLVMGFLGYSYMVSGSRLMFYFYYLASFLFIIAMGIHIFYVIPKEKKNRVADTETEKEEKSNSIASHEEKN